MEMTSELQMTYLDLEVHGCVMEQINMNTFQREMTKDSGEGAQQVKNYF